MNKRELVAAIGATALVGASVATAATMHVFDKPAAPLALAPATQPLEELDFVGAGSPATTTPAPTTAMPVFEAPAVASPAPAPAPQVTLAPIIETVYKDVPVVQKVAQPVAVPVPVPVPVPTPVAAARAVAPVGTKKATGKKETTPTTKKPVGVTTSTIARKPSTTILDDDADDDETPKELGLASDSANSRGSSSADVTTPAPAPAPAPPPAAEAPAPSPSVATPAPSVATTTTTVTPAITTTVAPIPTTTTTIAPVTTTTVAAVAIRVNPSERTVRIIGPTTFDVGNAGSVTVSSSGGSLVYESSATSVGVTANVATSSATRISVQFQWAGGRATFSGEFENNQLHYQIG